MQGSIFVKLKRVTVTNHARVADLDLEVRDHLVLVGPNNVGKSALLRCLDLLLGSSTAQLYQLIVPADFRDPAEPLEIRADLGELTDEGMALFPDELDTTTGTLTVQLVATLDAAHNLSITRTGPNGGTQRQLSREQIAGIGWRLLGATGLSRDLREDRRSAVDDILQAVELGAEQADFDTLIAALEEKLQSSTVLDTLRGSLATQLSRALPSEVEKDDLVFLPGAAADHDVLSGVSLQVLDDGEPRSITDQSDGTRALYVIALYDLVSASANLVAIDEPEIHLHPTSQRSLAGLLLAGANQKILATHSPDFVGMFSPDCIVAVRDGGTFVQPKSAFLSDDERMRVRWWVRDRLEPLTARHVIAVEGISDRIILQRASDVTDRNLDRLGVSVIETGGSGDMPAMIKLFGADGFQVLMSLLIDKDALETTAEALAVDPADLEKHRVWTSDPDLEAEYVAALGPAAVWQAIETSGLFSASQRSNCEMTGTDGTRTHDDVARFCRRRRYKVSAALAVAPLITAAVAPELKSVGALLDAVAS